MNQFFVIVAISTSTQVLSRPTDLELIERLGDKNQVRYDETSDLELMTLKEFEKTVNEVSLDGEDHIRFVQFTKEVQTTIKVIE